jgi:hypothetical protein
MSITRKIEMIATKTSFAKAEEDDLLYWMNQTATVRLKEMLELKKMIWTSAKNPYPLHVDKIGEKKIKSQTDEDEF